MLREADLRLSSRDAGTGGQWGQLAPTTLKLWCVPPTLDCESGSFLFIFLFLHVNLGLYQKIVGQIRFFLVVGRG